MLLGYCLHDTSDRLSVEEKVDPRVNKIESIQSREIFLGADLHNPECSRLCTENLFRSAARNKQTTEFENNTWKFHPLSHEQRYRELIKSVIQFRDRDGIEK